MKAQEDINTIYDRYSKHLYFSSLRIVGNSFDAQEIMQDTLLKYHSYNNKESIKDLSKWLKSICIRKSLDKLREKNRNNNFLEEYKEYSETQLGNNHNTTSYSIEKIKEALTLLPDNYRAILSLHLLEGYDYEEISQITSVKEVTIRTIYMRAKNKLLSIIKD